MELQHPDPDRLFASPPQHPHWIDSACFYFLVPERRLHGIIFYFFRPNLGMLTGGPVVWDPTGHTVLDCRHSNFSHVQALPQDAQKFDFCAANSLEVRTLAPKHHYALAYDFGGLALDLQWCSDGPIHAAPQRDPSSYHAEQTGTMTGSITLGGERIAVNCASLRDFSQGVRDYASIRPGAYCWGANNSTAFQALAMGTGRTQKIFSGFVRINDTTAKLVSGVRHIEEYGRYGARRMSIDAIDALGRKLKVTGILDQGLLFSGNSTHTVVWSQTRWQCQDGDCWGDNQEFYPAPLFRQIARGELTPEHLPD